MTQHGEVEAVAEAIRKACPGLAILDFGSVDVIAKAAIAALDEHRAAQADDEARALVEALICAADSAGRCANGGNGLVATDEDDEAQQEYEREVETLKTAVLARMRGVVIDDAAVERACESFRRFYPLSGFPSLGRCDACRARRPAMKAYRVKIELELFLPGTSAQQVTDDMDETIALWMVEPLMGLHWTDGKVYRARRAKDLDALVESYLSAETVTGISDFYTPSEGEG